MCQVLFALTAKLRLVLVLSTLWAGMAQAHEVVPTVGEVSQEGATLRLQLLLNLDAFLAGIDLTRFSDTNLAPEAEAYDVLRALPVDDVAARAGDLVPGWNAVPLVRVDGAPLALSLQTAEVLAEDNIELPRSAQLILTAPLAPRARTLEVTWPEDAGALILRQQGVEAPFTGFLAPGVPSGPITLAGGDAPVGWQAFADYIAVGFDHIVPKGLDHILFVLGLFFLSIRLGPLLWQVTAFTLAHSVTLALAALGLVTVPASVVEPLIAASIVFVAVENLFARGLTPWRPAVVFGFGLLHGLGFASVLGNFGLPEGAFLPALVGFNIGVEIGQLSVIAAAALLLWLGARVAAATGRTEVADFAVMHRAFSVIGSLVIAGIGLWWVV